MKWEQEYDILDIESVTDVLNHTVCRGDSVVWASSSSVGRPYFAMGKVIGFTMSPSFTYAVVKSNKNRIVKKLGISLLKVTE